MESTQNVMGSELRPGDLIWNSGYLWRVLDTKHEVYTLIHDPEVRRWAVTCEWSGIGTDPKFFNDNIGFARREDLPWTRAVNAQDSLAANRVVARNLVCQNDGVRPGDSIQRRELAPVRRSGDRSG